MARCNGAWVRLFAGLCLLIDASAGCTKSNKNNQSTSAANGSSGSAAVSAGTGAAGTAPVATAGAGGATASGTSGKPASSAAGTGVSTAGSSQTGSSGTGVAGAAGTGASGAGGGAMAAAGAGGAGGAQAGSGGAGAGTGCTRDMLKGAIDDFYAALAAHDSSKLALDSSAKFTENGKMMNVGDGIWKTAGMVKFKRSALDTMTCMSATESVLPESMTDRIYGLRLKLVNGKVTEMETIIVRDGDYILNNPAGLSGSASDDWETVLAPDKQTSRDMLMMLMDRYMTQFPMGACGFASDCTRLEDGGSVGPCVDGSLVTCNMNSNSSTPVLKPRTHVIDVDAGIVVGFTMFLGGYTDFHLFKVRDGQVHGVHAVLATAMSSGWD